MINGSLQPLDWQKIGKNKEKAYAQNIQCKALLFHNMCKLFLVDGVCGLLQYFILTYVCRFTTYEHLIIQLKL